MNTSIALKQLKEIEKCIPGKVRLAAENWDKDWKCLIATMLSAQTRDEKTIEISEKLFDKFKTLQSLANASVSQIEKEIRSINYYKTKARHLSETAKIISKNGFPKDFEGLLELPGVGRKTANVFLAEWKKEQAIGVDTHVTRISQKMGWTKNKDKFKIEKDLQKLFPEKYWSEINYILVRFGRTIGKKRKEEDTVLNSIKKKYL